MRYLLLVLLLSTSMFAQLGEVSIFGEGLFVPHKTGGLGGRGSVLFDKHFGLEAEGTWNFHSATFNSGMTPLYQFGYSFLAGPRFNFSPYLFITGKGGVLHTVTSSEDVKIFNPDNTVTDIPGQVISKTNAGVGYVGAGVELGDPWGLRIEGGNIITPDRATNLRITAGIYFRF